METWLVVAAVLVGALVKGVTGLGLPPIALAILAPILGAEHAVVVLSLPTVLSNGWLLAAHRRSLGTTDHLLVLVVAGIVGAVTGAWLLVWLDEAAVALGLATVVLVYAVVYLTRPELSLPPGVARWLAGPVGLAAGALQGASGISSPVLVTYLHARRLARPAFLAAISLLFQVFALAQFAGIVGFGLLGGQRLLHGGAAAAAAVVAVPLGMRMASHLPQRTFERATLVVLVGSSVLLVAQNL